MPTQGQKVDAKFLDIEGNLSHSLGGVGVKQHPARATPGGNLGDGLEDSNLSVRGQHRDQNGVIPNRFEHILGPDDAVGIGEYNRLQKPIPFQGLDGHDHRGVFDRCGHQVFSFTGLGVSYPLDGQVVGLGGPRGKDDLVGTGVDQIRQVPAGLLDRLSRAESPVVVGTGWVAVIRSQIGHHGIQCPGMERSGGVVVQIDRPGHDVEYGGKRVEFPWVMSSTGISGKCPAQCARSRVDSRSTSTRAL